MGKGKKRRAEKKAARQSKKASKKAEKKANRQQRKDDRQAKKLERVHARQEVRKQRLANRLEAKKAKWEAKKNMKSFGEQAQDVLDGVGGAIGGIFGKGDSSENFENLPAFSSNSVGENVGFNGVSSRMLDKNNDDFSLDEEIVELKNDVPLLSEPLIYLGLKKDPRI